LALYRLSHSAGFLFAIFESDFGEKVSRRHFKVGRNLKQGLQGDVLRALLYASVISPGELSVMRERLLGKSKGSAALPDS
jgi:hypothetical protein